MIEEVGYFGEGPKVQDILEGNYVPPTFLDDSTIAFLEACKRVPSTDIPLMPKEERFEKFKASWKVRKEKTCSYNQHIGHFKAAMRHPELSNLLFQRSEIPELTGYSPQRHREQICAQN